MTMDHKWKFSQCFGDKGDVENITEADIISTVEFDGTGQFLATGDKGGRVVLFERNQSKKNACEYKFFTEFQSHDAEFDYLKSLEVEEKINKIKWLKSSNNALYLLLTNDKTIKLWKVLERQVKLVSENNLNGAANLPAKMGLLDLKFPKMAFHDKLILAQPKRIYLNAHAYHINLISVNLDQETYLSLDDLRINLWNLDIPDQLFNIVDIKPANMEELTEVITSAEFHPQHCNLFMYSLLKGTLKLSDMRLNSLCDLHAKVFEEYLDPALHNFFTEITSLISDVKFSHDGRYVVSRDYMTVKIWDLAMERQPLKTIQVHENLRDRLCDTYDNDAIFDKFEVQFSGDNRSVMTGSYNNNFMIYPSAVDLAPQKIDFSRKNALDDDDLDHDDETEAPPAQGAYPNSPQYGDDDTQEEIVLQADKSAFKAKKTGERRRLMSGVGTGDHNDYIDFKKSILHLSWHPQENSVAIAATNNLYIFSAL